MVRAILIGVLVSVSGRLVLVKLLEQGQECLGVFNQAGPDCQRDPRPSSESFDSFLVQISAIFSALGMWKTSSRLFFLEIVPLRLRISESLA